VAENHRPVADVRCGLGGAGRRRRVERHSRGSIARSGRTTEFGVLEVLSQGGAAGVRGQRRILVESSSTTYVVDTTREKRGLVRDATRNRRRVVS